MFLFFEYFHPIFIDYGYKYFAVVYFSFYSVFEIFTDMYFFILKYTIFIFLT